MTTTSNCPRCGRVIELEPHPDKPGRMVGRCVCNPAGPVVEVDAGPDPLLALPGVDEEVAADLHERGLHNLANVRRVSDEELLAVPHIGERTLKKIRAFLAQEDEK